MNHKPRNILILKGNGKPLKAVKSGRNELCSCGSGLKSKKCCNKNTQYYKTDPTFERKYTKE